MSHFFYCKCKKKRHFLRMRMSFGRQPEFANDLRIELFDEQRLLSKLIKTLRLRQYQRFQDVTSAVVGLTLHDFAVIIHSFIIIINLSC